MTATCAPARLPQRRQRVAAVEAQASEVEQLREEICELRMDLAHAHGREEELHAQLDEVRRASAAEVAELRAQLARQTKALREATFQLRLQESHARFVADDAATLPSKLEELKRLEADLQEREASAAHRQSEAWVRPRRTRRNASVHQTLYEREPSFAEVISSDDDGKQGACVADVDAVDENSSETETTEPGTPCSLGSPDSVSLSGSSRKGSTASVSTSASPRRNAHPWGARRVAKSGSDYNFGDLGASGDEVPQKAYAGLHRNWSKSTAASTSVEEFS
eukprot:TRINITY_DN26344_c0_g1_i1.p1 TRINITY_DN26344_c0_g1~~TRINITY_DN26344_c0_g1_i1.p1  ORF type:complete len:289 (-),score=73.36 TRINITY_DN26344_c0_g1_i1:114-953(-)